MNVRELREKDVQTLKDLLVDLRKGQFNLRMERATGQLSDVSRFRKTRRDVAQVKTIIREKAVQDSK